jgi:hypothetical protein
MVKPVVVIASPEKFIHSIINDRSPVSKVFAVTARIDTLELVKMGIHDLVEGGVRGATGMIKIRGIGSTRA